MPNDDAKCVSSHLSPYLPAGHHKKWWKGKASVQDSKGQCQKGVLDSETEKNEIANASEKELNYWKF